MRHTLIYSIFFSLLGVGLIGMGLIREDGGREVKVKQASIRYGYKRPFSFYYPYDYQYYYPRPRYREGSAFCKRVFVNGNYRYYCG
jgi:hypothetical protein